jgi:hypothetical protein
VLIHRHTHLDEFLVQKGYYEVQSVGARAPIGAESVELVDESQTSHVLARERLHVGRFMKVKVAAQDLVTPFTRKYIPTRRVLLDVLAQEPHGRARSNRGGIVTFERMDHVVDVIDTLTRRERHLGMIRLEVLGDTSRGQEVGTALQTYGEGLDGPHFSGGDGRDEATVQPPRKEESHVALGGFESVVDRVLQRLSDDSVVIMDEVPVHRPIGGVITHEIVHVGIVDVTRWEDVYLTVQPQQGLDLTRERDGPFVVPGVEQWTHAVRITGGHDALTVRVDEGEIAVNVVLDRIENTERIYDWDEDLTIGGSLESFVVSEPLVVINLTVAHQHFLVPYEWLHTRRREIVYRQPVKVHATPPDLLTRVPIRSPVVQEVRRRLDVLPEECQYTTHVEYSITSFLSW